MRISCPICQREEKVADDFPYRPFCSRRCKMIDLGNWLDDVYRVARPDLDVDDPSASGSHRALPLMLTTEDSQDTGS